MNIFSQILQKNKEVAFNELTKSKVLAQDLTTERYKQTEKALACPKCGDLNKCFVVNDSVNNANMLDVQCPNCQSEWGANKEECYLSQQNEPAHRIKRRRENIGLGSFKLHKKLGKTVDGL